MSGKENFKAVRNNHLDNIMTEYGVDKDTAYQTLAEALDNPMVLNALSKVIADICEKRTQNHGKSVRGVGERIFDKGKHKILKGGESDVYRQLLTV